MDIDIKELGRSLSAQFQGLSGRPPGQWPLAPRILCGLGVMAAVVVAGHFAYWSSQFEEHEGLVAQEAKLKEEYRSKMEQAINLEALKAQRVQVDRYVGLLEKQLPSKAEMAALLSDINQSGLGRGLQFELFKPGAVVLRDYYAELPIAIKVTGSYHDLGAFASDMANLPRIVTLNNMSLTAPKDGKDKDAKAAGVLTLEAVAKTFRYLDPEEAAAAQELKAEREKKEGKGKGKGKDTGKKANKGKSK